MTNQVKYERPMIVQIAHAHASKYGTNLTKHIREKKEVDGVAISSLVDKYGTPLFVFSEQKIEELYQRAKDSFSSSYPNVQFSWSYKTNYLKAICSIFHNMGSTAEVVSEFEYEKAKALGINGPNIIYNGPSKSEASLILAIQDGANIHIDNFEELIQVNALAIKLKMKARVGIRINLNVGVYPQWSRFGFNYETGQVYSAIKKIMQLNSLNLVGIHTHIGTFMLEPQSYEIAASKMADIFNSVKSDYNHTIEYIDLGGGFPSKSHLRGVYQAPEIAVKDIEVYSQKITNALKNKIDSEDLPKLILETGRHLIDEAGYLLTNVITSKVMPDGKRSYVLDAGVNLLYTSTWYNYQLFSSSEITGIAEPAILNGPLCMNIDVIDSNISLPYIKSGTNMILHPVGAYNVTQAMQFIKYKPAVVLIDKLGNDHLIKKIDTLETVEKEELLPDFLKK